MANSSSTTGTDSGNAAAPAAGAPVAPAKVAEVRKSRPVISVGSSGSTVAALQKALNKDGKARAEAAEVEFVEVTEDGVFGYWTAKEVKNFQRANGLAADGAVSDVVWEKLGI